MRRCCHVLPSLSSLLLVAACATAPRASYAPTERCQAAWGRIEYVLRGGLETYLDGMRRYAAVSHPGASTQAAEARARARSDRWAKDHREALQRSCETWSDDRERCVAGAANAAALKHCGLEDLVQSYTDEVLTEYATQPFDDGPPARP